MTYPNLYTRLSNFTRDANNGLESPAPAKVDAELNGIQLSLAQVIDRMKAVTSADGRLKNLAQSLAAALVDTWQGPSTANPTVTDIVWDSTYSYESVMVMVGGVLLVPNGSTFTLSDSAGYLAITFATAPTLGTPVSAWAFAPGAGIVTRLAALTTGDGASMVGVRDAGNFYGAATVEGALQEVASSLVALQNNLGNVAELFLRDGSVKATADFDMDGNQIKNNADGVDPGDLVTLRQVANYIAAWTDLARFFLKRDGTAAMAGPLNFGNNKGYNLADPDLAQPLDAVNVRSMLKTISTSGASPVGTVVDFLGETAPTNWLFCDGQAYLGTAYPVFYGLLGAAFKSGRAQGAVAASFPLLIGANLTVPAGPGGIANLPALTVPGIGYRGIPRIVVENPPQYALVAVAQPTFTVTVTTPVVDGPNVTDGELTITLLTPGSGFYPGAAIVIYDDLLATPGSPALTPLPSGYFRTPDMRGRVSIGSGTESKSPGITDPPQLIKGDDYDATPHELGDYDGEEKHRLTVAELARHHHRYTYSGNSFRERDSGTGARYSATPRTEAYAGEDTAHNNMPPFVALNKIVKVA